MGVGHGCCPPFQELTKNDDKCRGITVVGYEYEDNDHDPAEGGGISTGRQWGR